MVAGVGRRGKEGWHHWDKNGRRQMEWLQDDRVSLWFVRFTDIIIYVILVLFLKITRIATSNHLNVLIDLTEKISER